MIVDRTSLITITAIVSVTLVGVIALTRKTDIKLDLNLGKNQSLTIEGKRSLPEPTKVDCLPGEENSQLLKCNS